MNEFSLMERFADPKLFDTLDLGDKVAGSLVTTLIGMGVTIAVLVLIWIAIAVMARVLRVNPTKVMEAPKNASSSAQESCVQETTGPSGELVAVLMAAIAAAEGSSPASNLVIRKINRVAGSKPAWRTVGISESIDSRRI